MVKHVYREQDVTGLLYFEETLSKEIVTVMFTTDSRGETLSLSDVKHGVMITVAFEDIDKIIKEARHDKNSGI